MELRPAAKALLAVRGYDPVLGARPLRRTIQRSIEDMLSEKILFGELKAGQIVIVDVEGEGEEAQFSFKGVPKPDRCPTPPWPRSRAARPSSSRRAVPPRASSPHITSGPGRETGHGPEACSGAVRGQRLLGTSLITMDASRGISSASWRTRSATSRSRPGARTPPCPRTGLAAGAGDGRRGYRRMR